MSQNSHVTTESEKKLITVDIPGVQAPQRTRVNILWTGGLDSTFRIVHLSMMDLEIQPYYLSDKRTSENYELNAMSSILKEIKNHPETKGIILPVSKFNVSDLVEDISVYNSYKKLYATHTIGSQYEWLGRFSRLVPGIELCVEKSERGRVYNCLQKNGKFIKIDEGILSYYIMDKENSNPDLVNVFGDFHFPYPLFEITKLQMIDLYKEWDFESVMQNTWFCHTPINNQPCGLCTPCMAAMVEGLSFRLPASGIKRFNNRMRYGDTRWFKLYMRYRVKLWNTFNV